MRRRLISILGILALAVAFLPAVTEGLPAPEPDCCNGVMCPMHQMAGGHMICDMDGSHHDAAFDSCPAPAQHYAAAVAFVRVAPPALAAVRPAGRAPAFTLPAARHADFEVLSPPPRASLV